MAQTGDFTEFGRNCAVRVIRTNQIPFIQSRELATDDDDHHHHGAALSFSPLAAVSGICAAAGGSGKPGIQGCKPAF
jgi:hypothetical protein